jgi:hypothetical protein
LLFFTHVFALQWLCALLARMLLVRRVAFSRQKSPA